MSIDHAQRSRIEGDFITVDKDMFDSLVTAVGEIHRLTAYAVQLSEAFKHAAPMLAMMAPGISLPEFPTRKGK
jgi:hypothetical protein